MAKEIYDRMDRNGSDKVAKTNVFGQTVLSACSHIDNRDGK